MKRNVLKNIFFSLVAVLSLGATFSIAAYGVNKSQEAVVETSAATYTTVYCAIDTTTLKSYSMKLNINRKGDGNDWATYDMTDLATTYDSKKVFSVSFTDLYDGLGCIQFQLLDGSTWKEQDEVFTSWTWASEYNNKLHVYKGTGWVNYNPPTSHTVTKRAVVDGTLKADSGEWSLGTDNVPHNASYAYPSDINKNGYYFDGWYTNEACTTSYTARNISDALTIYAKYTSWTDYIYYIGGSSPVFTNIYVFKDSSAYGTSWAGDPLSSASYVSEVHGVLHFEGTDQPIYKINVPTKTGFKIILNNGSAQTYDITPTAGAGYYFWLNDGESKYSYSTNMNAGAALDLLLRAESIRNSVTASGKIKDYSICGISPTDAASLYNEYYDLVADAKHMVDTTTAYTYVSTTSSKDDISYADIMAQLHEIAVQGKVAVKGANTSIVMFGVSDSNSTFIIIIAIVSLTVLGGYFFIRRRKTSK